MEHQLHSDAGLSRRGVVDARKGIAQLAAAQGTASQLVGRRIDGWSHSGQVRFARRRPETGQHQTTQLDCRLVSRATQQGTAGECFLGLIYF